MAICDFSAKNLKVIFNYLIADLIRKQRSFKIGLLSIFMVVFFLTMLWNTITLTPCIFLRLSEQQVGEADMLFTPYIGKIPSQNLSNKFDQFYSNKGSISTLPSMNFLDYYYIKNKTKDIDFVEGIAPRWIIMGNTSTIDNKYSSDVNIIILNSEIENNIGYGRKLNLPELNESECYVSKPLFEALKAKIGDVIQMEIRLSGVLKAFVGIDENQMIMQNTIKKKKKKFQNDITYHNDDGTFKSTSGNVNHPNDFDLIKYYSDKKNTKERYKLLMEKYINNNTSENEKKEKINNNNDNYVKNMGKSSVFKSLFMRILKENFGKYLEIKINKEGINDILERKIKVDKNIINMINKIISNIKLTKSSITKFIKDNIKDIKISTVILLYINSLKTIDETISNVDLINRFITLDNKTNEIYINSELKTIIQSSISLIGDFNFDMNEIIKKSVDKIDNIDLDSLLSFRTNLTIKEKIKATGGKWPSASGNVIAFDERFLKKHVITNISYIISYLSRLYPSLAPILSQIQAYILKLLEDFDPKKYSLSLSLLINNKFFTYSKSSDFTRRFLSQKASDIAEKVGYFLPYSVSSPILSTLEGLKFAQIFAENVFVSIAVLLWMIGTVLVYAIMSGNVEERTYEYGMMRALGFRKSNLILIILIQGLIFAIPGIILGIVSSYVTNNYIAFLLNWYSALVMPYFISIDTIILGVIIGISMTLFSSYFPIKKCLENNLKETLTLFNKKIGDLVVSIVKLEKIGISPTTLTASLTLILIGFFTYYVAPLSFVLNNPSIFIFIMMCILLVMLLGLILLSQLIVPYIEKGVLKIIRLFCLKDSPLIHLSLSNLSGHSARNRKVSLIFSLSIGFAVFSGSSLALLPDFVSGLSKSTLGGDVAAWLAEEKNNNTLDERGITGFLEGVKKNFPGLVKEYEFYGMSLNKILDQKVYFSTLNGFPSNRRKVIPLGRNYISSGYSDLYIPSEYNKFLPNKTFINKNKIDIVKLLYDNPNTDKIINNTNSSIFVHPFDYSHLSSVISLTNNFEFRALAAEGIRRTSAISIDNPGMVSIEIRSSQNFPCKIIGFARKIPGWALYSSYSSLSQQSEIFVDNGQIKELISIEKKLFPKLYNISTKSEEIIKERTFDGVRKKGFIIKFYDNSTTDKKEMVYYGIKNYFKGENVIVTQLDDIIETANEVRDVMEYIFLVLGLISLILSFFLVWTSFYSNLRDNIAEYGITRAIGLTKSQGARVYMYEAASIIISSIIIGTMIGTFISATLILQFDIFVELPFTFNFPVKLYTILVVSGLILGLLGSYYPIHEVNKISLVSIMKGINE